MRDCEFERFAGRVLACSPDSTRPLNMLPMADLGELRDPVLAVPAV
jgi:hypothetical protein